MVHLRMDNGPRKVPKLSDHDHVENREASLAYHTFDSWWSSRIHRWLPESKLSMVALTATNTIQPWCRVENPVSQFECAISDGRHQPVGGETNCRVCVDTWSDFHTKWSTECREAALSTDGPERLQVLQYRLLRFKDKYPPFRWHQRQLDRLQLRLEMTANGVQWRGGLEELPRMLKKADEWADGIGQFVASSTFEVVHVEALVRVEVTYEDCVVAVAEGATTVYIDSAERLKEIVLPTSMTIIRQYQFARCARLETVHISPSTVSIDTSAFYNCKNLASIQLPKDLRVLGAQAFCNCQSLRAIEIPQGVAEIGSGALSGCIRLKHVKILDGVGTIHSVAFSRCVSLEQIRVPQSVHTIGESAFQACGRLRKITLPDQLSIIEAGVFQDCVALKDILWPSSLERIYTHAFENCSSLTDLYLPDSLIVVEPFAFRSCRLTMVSISAETIVARDAFEAGTNFTIRAQRHNAPCVSPGSWSEED